MKGKPLFWAHAAVLSANVIYGLNYVIAKGIMPDYLLPRPIIFLRVSFSLLIFFIADSFSGFEQVNRKDLGRMAVAAFFGVALNQIMFFEGLNLTTPINASLIMVMVPIMVLVFSQLLRVEQITWLKGLGILMGAMGSSYLILGKGHMSLHHEYLFGNLMILINASSYALFLVLIKPVMFRYKPLTVMKWVFFFGWLVVLPFTLPLALQANWAALPLSVWLSIGYVILFTTVLAYFLNNYSLKQLNPSANSVYIYTQPLIAAIVATALGTDQLNIEEMTAALLIFAGVFFSISPMRIKKLQP